MTTNTQLRNSSTTTNLTTIESCELCSREKNLQFHHLIPKQLHSKKKYLRQHTKRFMRSYGIYICKDCHKQIHKMFTHHFLAESLNDLAKLKTNDKIKKYLKWIQKQK